MEVATSRANKWYHPKRKDEHEYVEEALARCVCSLFGIILLYPPSVYQKIKKDKEMGLLRRGKCVSVQIYAVRR